MISSDMAGHDPVDDKSVNACCRLRPYSGRPPARNGGLSGETS
jgi:hypothetical protein